MSNIFKHVVLNIFSLFYKYLQSQTWWAGKHGRVWKRQRRQKIVSTRLVIFTTFILVWKSWQALFSLVFVLNFSKPIFPFTQSTRALFFLLNSPSLSSHVHNLLKHLALWFQNSPQAWVQYFLCKTIDRTDPVRYFQGVITKCHPCYSQQFFLKMLLVWRQW